MKKALLLMIVLCVCLSAAFSLQIGGSAEADCSAAFAFPTKDYLKISCGPVARTSMSVDGDVMLDVKFPVARWAMSVDAGLALDWTSRSLEWNNTMLRAYRGVGGVVGVAFYFNDYFNLGLKYRVLYCTQVLSGNHFLSMDYELVPCYTPVRAKYCKVGITAPLVVSVKADTVTLRAGLGVKLGFNTKELMAK